MASLQLTFDSLKVILAEYLGYSVTPADWTTAESDRMNRIINAGYRNFLIPELPEGHPHRWSFLDPEGTLYTWTDVTGITASPNAYEDDFEGETQLTFVGDITVRDSMIGTNVDFTVSGNSYPMVRRKFTSGVAETGTIYVKGDASGESGACTITSRNRYALPSDFGGIRGEFYFDTGEGFGPCRITNFHDIMKMLQYNNGTGRPTLAALIPTNVREGSTGDSMYTRRSEVVFYLEPDAEYAMKFRYTINPDELNATDEQMPLGTMQHSELLKECILAEAELQLDDELGIHNAKMRTKLIAAIRADRALMPPNLGYCGDHSDMQHYYQHRLLRPRKVSYEGTFYGP